jgi:hypothetical protein
MKKNNPIHIMLDENKNNPVHINEYANGVFGKFLFDKLF